MTKGFLFFFLGLLAIMGVVGGIEQTVDISLFQGIQLLVVTLVGFGTFKTAERKARKGRSNGSTSIHNRFNN